MVLVSSKCMQRWARVFRAGGSSLLIPIAYHLGCRTADSYKGDAVLDLGFGEEGRDRGARHHPSI